MMLKRITLTIITLMLQSLLYSQDLVDFYSKHLPQITLLNSSTKNQVNNKLIEYSQINTEIIYYYINHLQKLYNQSITNPNSNFRLELENKITFEKRRKNIWNDKMKKIIEDTYPGGLRRRKILKYFSNYKIYEPRTTLTNFSSEVDENKKNFFTYMYLTQNNEIKYDSTQNYLQLCKTEINKLISKYNKYYNLSGDLKNAESESILTEAAQYAFIFKDTYFDLYSNTTDFYFHDFINKVIENNFYNHWEIGAHYTFYFAQLSFEKNISVVDPFNRHFDYTINVDQNIYSFLGAGIKIKMGEEIKPLSSFHINLGILVTQNYQVDISDSVLFSGLIARPGLFFNGQYILSDFRDFNSSAYMVTLTTPILYISRSFYFEVGLNYVYHTYSFDYDFLKEGTLRHPGYIEKPEFYNDETITVSDDSHLINGLLSLNLSLFKYIHFRSSYLIPTRFMVEARIQIQI